MLISTTVPLICWMRLVLKWQEKVYETYFSCHTHWVCLWGWVYIPSPLRVILCSFMKAGDQVTEPQWWAINTHHRISSVTPHLSFQAFYKSRGWKLSLIHIHKWQRVIEKVTPYLRNTHILQNWVDTLDILSNCELFKIDATAKKNGHARFIDTDNDAFLKSAF